MKSSPSRSRWPVAVALLCSSVLSLLAVEVALRVRRGGVFSAKPPGADARMVGGYPAAWDAELGYVPKPGTRGRNNPWRTRVTIDAQGIRANGRRSAAAGAAVLAVGDSFTFGDEVDDHETWPAALERRLARPVINGGVFGYGFDQIVLRAERMLATNRYGSLVVSVIPDDVVRCEYAFRYGHKPWFDVAEDALVLHNVPVPRPEQPPPGESALRGALRKSFLAEFVVHRLDPLGWLIRGNVRVHRNRVAVARALVDRLAEASVRDDHRLLIVAAWHPGAKTEQLASVLSRARERGVEVLELESLIRSEVDAARDDWFTSVEQNGARRLGHMTAYGNDRVARAIADRLRAPESRR